MDERASISPRIEKMRQLCYRSNDATDWYEAASIGQSVLHETVGGGHPLSREIQHALEKSDFSRALAAGRSVITLYEQGSLISPRLAIAHEIESDILDVAQAQLEAAEVNQDLPQKQLQLAIAAFLSGAALEDALRRMCTSRGIAFDSSRTSIAKLQASLYQPSKQVEIISSSENKQITAWGDTRNKADHGQFAAVTYAEVLAMVVGVRAFLDRHLP